jgi:hypothetical protein
MLALDVPQGDVDGAHRGAPHPGLGARVELFEQLIPDALGFQRILASEKRRNFTVDEFPDRKALRAAG